MFKKGTFSSNFLVLFSGNTIAQIVPFIFAALITRLFSTDEIGIHRNFLALASMIAIAAAGRYEMAVVLPADKTRAMNLLSLSLRLILYVTLGSLLFYFFRDWLDATIYEDGNIGSYMIFLPLAVILFALTNLLSQWLIREKKFRSLTSSGIARSAFINIFAVMFGYVSMGVLGLILGTIVGFLVALVMMYLSSYRSFEGSLISSAGRRQVASEYKDFPLINAPHAFVDLLFAAIFFAVITRDYGLTELGYFSMMSALLLASMRAIGGAVGQLYYKEASDLKESGGDVSAVMFRSIKLVSLFAVPACIGVFLFGPELFGWYLGVDAEHDYTVSGQYAQIMIFPFFLNFIISPISGTPIIFRKQTQAFVFSLIGYIASISAFMIGKQLGYSFKEALVLYAVAQTLYYLGLFIWYINLAKTRP
ncbi:MAG: oligosaccharide flippase family protein [Bacteroidetes bacterium]|nr:oligosaccharide flippase family protein [Bacteroidota bacterium]